MAGNGSESHAVAMARLQGDIEALQQRVDRLERQVGEVETALERRHAELREEVRRGLDAQTAGLGKLTHRFDSAVANLSSRVTPEMAQRLAEARAREAASRAWAAALLGALAVLAAGILTLLKR